MKSTHHDGWPRGWRAAGVLAAVLLIGACEGSNLFEAQVTQESPELTLIAPASVETGTTFTIQALATASSGVRFIEIRVSGAATDSIREEFSGTSSTGSASLSVTPSSAIGAQVVIDAFAQDVNGLNSTTARATVSVTPVSPGAARSN